MNERGVTTEADLQSQRMVPEDVAAEVAEEIAGDIEIERKREQERAKRAIKMTHSRDDSLVFYRRNGQRCEISCGTDLHTKTQLLNYYLSKTINGQRVFFRNQPPGTEKGPPRWECFIPNGTGFECGKKHWEATTFLAHLLGFHRLEVTQTYPQVIEFLQREAQRELQPSVPKKLGMEDIAEPFEKEGAEIPELYWCKDHGHPECPRFFDSMHALMTHQRIPHKKEESNAEATELPGNADGA